MAQCQWIPQVQPWHSPKCLSWEQILLSRIIESFKLEGTSKVIESNHPEALQLGTDLQLEVHRQQQIHP